MGDVYGMIGAYEGVKQIVMVYSQDIESICFYYKALLRYL
jgi:hypothetical protein